MKRDVYFIDNHGNEFTEPEAIQDLMRRVSNLEERNAELSDLVNILIGRLGEIDRKVLD